MFLLRVVRIRKRALTQVVEAAREFGLDEDEVTDVFRAVFKNIALPVNLLGSMANIRHEASPIRISVNTAVNKDYHPIGCTDGIMIESHRIAARGRAHRCRRSVAQV